MILGGLTAFVISFLLGPAIIPILRRIKAGQTEREDGPESHKSKTGTPTMGGFIFLISIILADIWFTIQYPEIIPIVTLMMGFAVVGFLDDFIKVVLKRSEGLTPIQKAIGQLLVAGGYVAYLFMSGESALDMYVPFAGELTINIGWWSIPVFLFIILGTVNGSNFTDGVDGLEGCVTSGLCVFFLIATLGLKRDIASAPVIVLGALIGFLVFNIGKAKVFMGDTGSLALGGFVCGCAFSLGLQLYLPMIALVYFVEVLSVILQVGYFKISHGKRIFRMAPIHHHFELGGWNEAKVVGIFTIVTIVLCAIALIFVPTPLF